MGVLHQTFQVSKPYYRLLTPSFQTDKNQFTRSISTQVFLRHPQ